jgi:hypothetical protein
MGRSTATQVLAGLEAERRISRQAGGRDGARRLADHWFSVPSAPSEQKATSSTARDGQRTPLKRGELAAMVLGYVESHAGYHSPSAVAKALGGKSAGAVSNALARFTARGDVVQTSASPRR